MATAPALPSRPSPVNRLLHLLAAALILIAAASVWVVAGSRSPVTEAAAHHHPHSPSAEQTAPEPTVTGPMTPPVHGSGQTRSVLDFAGPSGGPPDVHYELTASTQTISTGDRQQVGALTYNGTAPGPVLRASAGQLVEVVLRNDDVATGVTIHWHGLDVPNAEDGVAGVTQDAVLPGQQHTYRFVPTQVGTFWYHSHQDAATTVARGLYGALIVDPPLGSESASAGPVVDLALVAHTWTDSSPARTEEITIGRSAGTSSQSVPVGRTARLRLINTDNLPQTWAVIGSAFRVVAIDGTDVVAPTDLQGTSLRLAGGGRYDIELTMPDEPVEVRLLELNQPRLQLIPDDGGAGAAQQIEADPAEFTRFDPLSYGAPSPSQPVGSASPFDRDVELILETRHGRRDGLPFAYWTINGQTAPNIPAISVAQGDLVRVHVVNKGTEVHPMHLHGHHVLVLSRGGVPSSGSPWWTDTLGVEPGEDFVFAFRADNPGIWMDHCHNLAHAAAGMMMQLTYTGVSTPFVMDHGNLPE